MGKIITGIKSSKIVNSGLIKKIKDKIYFKIISPNNEKKTDKYRVEIIEKFGQICKNCQWQLLAGSFLRYYRDNTMDGQDLDFFILDTDFEKIKDKFFNEGFYLKQIFVNNQNDITEYKFLYNEIEVDVFMMKKYKRNYVSMFTSEKIGAKDITRNVKGNTQIISGKDYCSYKRVINTFKKCTDYKYQNITFKGPKDPEGMLYECYGENWKVYDPSFDPRTCPANNLPIEYDNAKSIVYIKPISSFEDMDININ